MSLSAVPHDLLNYFLDQNLSDEPLLYLLLLQFVCKRFRAAVKAPRSKMCSRVLAYRDTARRSFHHARSEAGFDMCKRLPLDTVKWICKKFKLLPPNGRWMAGAAAGGNLETMRWLLSLHCSWTVYSMLENVVGLNVDVCERVVQWVFQNKPRRRRYWMTWLPWPHLADKACQAGNAPVALLFCKFAEWPICRSKVPWDRLRASAVMSGRVSVLKEVLAQAKNYIAVKPFVPSENLIQAGSSLEMLQHLLSLLPEKSPLPSADISSTAVQKNAFDVLQFLHDRGEPFAELLPYEAVRWGHVTCLKWCLSHGFVLRADDLPRNIRIFGSSQTVRQVISNALATCNAEIMSILHQQDARLVSPLTVTQTVQEELSRKSCVAAIRFLVSVGAWQTAYAQQCLQLACESRDANALELVRYFCEELKYTLPHARTYQLHWRRNQMRKDVLEYARNRTNPPGKRIW